MVMYSSSEEMVGPGYWVGFQGLLQRLYAWLLRRMPTERQRLLAVTILAGGLCGLAAVAFHLSIMGLEALLIDRANAAPGLSWMWLTIYILIAVAVLLKDANEFGALLQLSGALAGWLYVRHAPRRGIAFGFGEWYFGLRNAYYRAKRRHAAKKFEVYMGKQGREVHFDKEGRYVDPDEKKDPNDKRWMN